MKFYRKPNLYRANGQWWCHMRGVENWGLYSVYGRADTPARAYVDALWRCIGISRTKTRRA